MRAIGAALLVLIACRAPSSPTPSPQDATPPVDAGPLDAACERLRALGCPEGQPTPAGRACSDHLRDLDALVPVPAACLAAAKSKDAARACGDDSTTRVRCLP